MFYIRTLIPFILSLLLSLWTTKAVKILSAIFISPAFGLRCSEFTLFGCIFTNNGGKWKTSTGKFTLSNSYQVVIDMKKPIPADPSKNSLHFSLVTLFILILVTTGINFLSLGAWTAFFAGKMDFLTNLAFMYSVMMIANCITTLGITIYVYGVASERLVGYVDEKLNILRRGGSFEELGLKPLNELPFKKYTEAERQLYYAIYCTYLLALGRTEEMAPPIHEMTAFYRYRDYSPNDAAGISMLIFWYSRYELNAQEAAAFYAKAASALANDNDPNSRRILAYYAYGTERDPAKARFFLGQARSGIDDWKQGSDAEKQLERRLTDELDEFLKNDGF
jgi:hypothetical protein